MFTALVYLIALLSSFANYLGASACVELHRFEEAITWCDKGLVVSSHLYSLLYTL